MRRMRNGYISGGVVTVLLVIAATAIVYVTLKVKNLFDQIL